MKRFLSLLLLPICLLAGCGKNNDLDRVLSLRQSLLGGNGCSFDLQVTADYEDQIFVFSMQCVANTDGSVSFTILSPDTLNGISGQIGAQEGQLVFDETVLLFDLLADGTLSPISAPWLLVRTLTGGYISSGGKDDDFFLFQIDDSYEEDPIRLDIWLDRNNTPVAADILWNGRRVVALTIENFQLL